MHWLLVTFASLMFLGVVLLASHAKRTVDRQRRMWSDEEVRVLQRRARLSALHPANDRYPEVWPTEGTGRQR